MPESTPGPLRPVTSFLNSVDVDEGTDELVDLDRFRRWLVDHGHPEAAHTAGEAELALARRLRGELRDEVRTHHDGTGRPRSALDAVAAGIPLAARFGPDGAARPEPAGTGVLGVLGEVLAAVLLAAHDGSWRRVKICPADDCRWVYYDASRNSSRRWCSMRVCGNRSKTRTYRSATRAR